MHLAKVVEDRLSHSKTGQKIGASIQNWAFARLGRNGTRRDNVLSFCATTISAEKT